MKTTTKTTTRRPARFAVGATGLESPRAADIKPGHGYYLGASSSPSYVLVLSVTDDQIVYVDSYSLERRVVERWIGEDLIAKGRATVKRCAINANNSDSPFARAAWDRAMMHGAAVSPADYDRQEVSLRGVGRADHYGIAKNHGVLTGWDGAGAYVVECAASEARALAADGRFEVAGVRTIKACPVQ